jgi:hypothetical protein
VSHFADITITGGIVTLPGFAVIMFFDGILKPFLVSHLGPLDPSGFPTGNLLGAGGLVVKQPTLTSVVYIQVDSELESSPKLVYYLCHTSPQTRLL